MNLERVAAEAFLTELQKIAAESTDGLTKSAAAGLSVTLDVENIEALLKEAGFGDLMRGIGTGLGRMATGAGQGILQTGKNLVARGSQKLTGMGQSIQGAMTRAGDRMSGGFFKSPTVATAPAGTGAIAMPKAGVSIGQPKPMSPASGGAPITQRSPAPLSQAQRHQQLLAQDRGETTQMMSPIHQMAVQSQSTPTAVDPTMTMTRSAQPISQVFRRQPATYGSGGLAA